MSNPNILEQKILEVTAAKLMPCPSEAVFTLDQTEQIVKICVTIDHILVEEIEKLECRLEHLKGSNKYEELEKEIKLLKLELLKDDKFDDREINAKLHCLTNEIEQLIKYDEHNSCIVAEIKKNLEHTHCEVECIEAKLEKFEERVAVNLLSQAEELDRMTVINSSQSVKLKELQNELCELKKLATKDHVEEVVDELMCLKKRLEVLEHCELRKEMMELVACLEKRLSCLEKRVLRDERVDAILGMLSSFVTKEVIEELMCKIKHLELKECVDHRVDELLRRLCLLQTKEEAEKLVKRIATLEAKEIHDARVDLLLCELSKINHRLDQSTAVNVAQAEQLRVLFVQNANQAQQINCLNEKLNRNTLVLDNKIDVVERRELEEEKVDFNQNASLKFLQAEITKMARDIERLQKAALVRPPSCV